MMRVLGLALVMFALTTPAAKAEPVRYPAEPSHQPRAGYMQAAHARALVSQLNALAGTDYPDDLLTFPTHSRMDAPVEGTRHPVVVLSHGHGTNAAQHTGQAEELASRVADMSFVLDKLTDLTHGRNPDAEHRRLPAGLGRSLDLTRVAALGHSLGSMTVVRAMVADSRLDTGVVLDGAPLGNPGSIDRPVLMLGNQHHHRAELPDWADFYDRLLGQRLHLVLDGAEHADLTDITVFKETIDLSVVSPGPIDGERSLSIHADTSPHGSTTRYVIGTVRC